MEKNVFAQFDQGVVTVSGRNFDLGLCEWKQHPDFTGVFLKNLVTADLTNGLFTCHLVRIEPGHAIGQHFHANSMELHEVIQGSGTCTIPQGEVGYAPGAIAVMGRGELHAVRAGDEGLCLLAKFITVTT